MSFMLNRPNLQALNYERSIQYLVTTISRHKTSLQVLLGQVPFWLTVTVLLMTFLFKEITYFHTTCNKYKIQIGTLNRRMVVRFSYPNVYRVEYTKLSHYYSSGPRHSKTRHIPCATNTELVCTWACYRYSIILYNRISITSSRRSHL